MASYFMAYQQTFGEMMTKLSKTTIYLHWLVAIGFLGTMLIPFLPEDLSLTPTHKSLGLIVLCVAFVRLIWRIKEGFPEPTAPQPRLQLLLAKGAHIALLIATILMPLSGLAMSVGAGKGADIFGLVIFAKSPEKIEWLAELGKSIHFSALYVLIALISIHVLAALKHQFIDKDKLISRMVGKGG